MTEAPPDQDPLAELAAAVEARDAGDVHAATDALRERLEDAVRGRRVAPGSVLMERKRRVHQRLDRLDDAAAAGEWGRADDHAGPLPDPVRRVLEAARELPPHEPDPSPPRGPRALRNTTTVARKEVVTLLAGTRGLLLFGLLTLTFGLGLVSGLDGGVAGSGGSVRQVWNYAHSLDFLAIPLAGILVGYGLVNEELRSNTIHVLASKPVSRTGIVLGKWLGAAAALAGAVAASAGIVAAVAYALTGQLGRPSAAVLYPVASFLLALAFATIAMVASTLLHRTGPTLAASFAAYVLLGPVWQNAFLAGSLEAGGRAPVGRVLAYLATPFTAWWNWTGELLGPVNQATGLPTGEPWHAALVRAVETGTREALPFYATHPFYVLVLVAWIGLGLAGAHLALARRDLG